MIRVLIVADVRLYRDGLTHVLERRPGILVVGSASDGDQALGGAADLSPDVMLLDMAMPGAASTVQLLAEGMPTLRIVGLAVTESEEHVIAYIQAGIAGYVARDGSLDELVATIERTTRGELVCPAKITAALARRVASLTATEAASGLPRLSNRERQVAALVDRGMSNKQIAQELHIEVTTVKQHVHNILEKLHVHRRGEAAARLRRPSSVPTFQVASPIA